MSHPGGSSQFQSNAGSETQAPGNPKATILVVDDEPAVLRILVMRLQLAGYRVICAEDGEEALEIFHREQPDLLVLDVMLPRLDGFAVCRRLRAESCVPIIFLSALEAISERVAGLDLGADDYIPKPFSPKELEARIATILRRVGPGSATAEIRDLPVGQGVMRVGDLVVDTNRRQVSRAGERIGLTYTEFSLLELLFREPGRVVPRAEILEQLWGYPPRRAADLRVVDVYVARLRGKLEPDPRNPELILTVRGIGYSSQRVGDIPASASASASASAPASAPASASVAVAS
ncbi:response regulator transcription factor RpaB [Prochlorococcus marinus]|uniref:Probable transcriptional regulator ycf27 n=1 Tax=Prochlorococcus marinus (strain MIT 9303) TaxID=59922 RepID=A2C628_PROM3|nr:response regulator [Prochlorococcus marinus]ABM76938.1 two-component response regulator [Prochlorococcus marinus str. MIT 9303]